MRPLARVALGVLLAVSLAGCSALNPFASSGPEPARLADITTATVSFEPAWSVQVGDSEGYAFVPAVVGDAVYAASQRGNVVRVERGRTIWSVRTDKRLAAGVGSDGTLAVVVATDGAVIALDAHTGAERWRAGANAEVLAAPVINDGVVVVRASDSRVVAFDADDGKWRWMYQRTTPALALRNYPGLIAAEGVAVVGYPGGKLVAINLENGGPIWELTVASPRGVTELERMNDVAGTAVLGSDICAVTFHGRIACFDPRNGSSLWARDFSSAVGMDKDVRLAVATADDDSVHGLDGFNGSELWKQGGMARRQVTRPLIVDSVVVVGDREGYLHALDRETGHFVGRTRSDRSGIAVEPRAYDRSGVVVQTRSGGVHAYYVR